MTKGIQVNHLTKRFGETQALHDVTLTFQPNKIYGLLGRNGAGKSTLLNVISNRIFPTEGEVTIDGIPSMENDTALQNLYLMSEKTYYPKSMKIKKAFQWTKEFYPNFDRNYAYHLADLFRLNPNKSIKSLSTGYASIFKLIIALSTNAPYIFLDEPVLGLDANHRDLFYKVMLEKYSEGNSAFIISTHLIEEVANLIEEVIIIKNGVVIRNESCESLLSQGYTVSGKRSDVEAFIQNKQVIGTDVLGGMMIAHILGHLDEELPEQLEISRLDLQKLFVQLTN